MFEAVSRIWRALTGAHFLAPSHEPDPSPPGEGPFTTRTWGWRGRQGKVLQISHDAWTGRDIPGDLKIAGNLIITDFPRLRSIGDGLVVPGDLRVGGWRPDLRGLGYERRRVPLRALPRGLRVGGSLELHNCFRLERLPDGLSVGGSLVLEDCDALTVLPDSLEVRGSLTITGGQSLTALPTNLRVAGNFRLTGTRVTRLPAGLTVGGALVIQGRSRIASLPETIRVGGDIVLRHCLIESVPEGLRVARTLRLPGSRKLKRLPANLVVPGKLDLAGCTALEEVPPGLRVGHSLKLRGCRSLRSLPPGLEVPHTLDLRGCTSLTRLPPGLRVGFALPEPPAPAGGASRTALRPRRHFDPALRLADCINLTELPDDLRVGGPIEVAGSGLKDLPPSLAGARVLWRGVLVPPDVVFHPERIAPLDVLRQENAELRRVMMERVGPEAVLAGVKAKIRDADTDAGGPRQLVYIRELDHCYLYCRCPSTARQYLLRVPPNTRTCRHAAAWIAGFDDPDQYRPTVET